LHPHPSVTALAGDLGDRLNLGWAVSGMTVSGLTLETLNGNGLLIDQGRLAPEPSGTVQTAPDRDDAYRLTVWNDSEYTVCQSPAVAVAWQQPCYLDAIPLGAPGNRFRLDWFLAAATAPPSTPAARPSPPTTAVSKSPRRRAPTICLPCPAAPPAPPAPRCRCIG
jgi:hypothetical protein